MTATGSSPLTRGKRLFRSRISPRPGLIPAHAGKTLIAISHDSSGGAHPRSRGENDTLTVTRLTPLGSSPLTRGKLGHGPRGLRAARLIPAHAGKTVTLILCEPGYRAHPRSRGENFISFPHYVLRVGSSPLTRGKPRRIPRRIPRPRLIPAHAGKTLEWP